MSKQHLFNFSIVAVFATLSLGEALALPEQNLAPSQLIEMPRWPIYAAFLVATVIGVVKVYQYIGQRRVKARVFPKLQLRRRLYAPYSGGNHAGIRFGSSRDA
ncbi:MAG: hypothetical protein ACI8XO_002263 [Verrucomicrobiales bacterium]|jgi:hypothetical protein